MKPSKKTLLDAAQIIAEMANVIFEGRIKAKAGFDVVDADSRKAKVAFDHMNQIAKELREGAQ